MKILLDTHVFLWLDANDQRLPAGILEAAIASPGEIYVSAVSVWEIAIKRNSGKLIFAGSVSESIAGHEFIPLAITADHAERAGSLPAFHRDPFDRLLVAQAQMEGLVLATLDDQMMRYSVARL